MVLIYLIKKKKTLTCLNIYNLYNAFYAASLLIPRNHKYPAFVRDLFATRNTIQELQRFVFEIHFYNNHNAGPHKLDLSPDTESIITLYG